MHRDNGCKYIQSNSAYLHFMDCTHTSVVVKDGKEYVSTFQFY